MTTRAAELQAWIDAEGYKRRSIVRTLGKKKQSTRLGVQIEMPPADYMVDDFSNRYRGDQVMQSTCSDGSSYWAAWSNAHMVDTLVARENGKYWVRINDQNTLAGGQEGPRMYYGTTHTFTTGSWAEWVFNRKSGNSARPYFGVETAAAYGIVLFYLSDTVLQVYSNTGVRTVTSSLVVGTSYRLRVTYASDTTSYVTIWNDDTNEVIYGPTEWNNRDDAGVQRTWSSGVITAWYCATGGTNYNDQLFTRFQASWLPRTTAKQLEYFMTRLETRCWPHDVDCAWDVAHDATVIGETTALGVWSGYGTPGTFKKVVSGTDHYMHVIDTTALAGWGAVLTFDTPRDPGLGGVIDFDLYIIEPTMLGYFILENADASRGHTLYYHTTGGVLAFAGAGGVKYTSTVVPTEEWVHVRFEMLSDNTFSCWINSIPCVEVGGNSQIFTAGAPFNGSENCTRFRLYSDTGSVQKYYLKNVRCSWMPVRRALHVAKPTARYLGKHPVSKRENWDIEVEVDESW